MTKLFSIFGAIALVVLLGAGCGPGGAPYGQGEGGPGPAPGTENQVGGGGTVSGIQDVCNFFPKELIEEAIGRPIVKSEVPLSDKKICFYYTLYSDTFDHTPYGDEPGGTPVVVTYDYKDFAKDKISNEKTGSKYVKDNTIGMDNFVVSGSSGDIWQVVLVLGQDKYLEIHFVHDAVTGAELVKIGAKFAEKIKGQ